MKKTVLCLALVSLLASTAAARAAFLESPAHEATLSGIGFISGWKCDAANITVTIDEGDHLSVAMHQERGDLLIQKTCGETIRHGFIMQINWANVGDGEHTVVAYDNGMEFDRATFTVGSTGEEFLSGVRRRTVVDGFPAPGERALLEWNESTQHFEIRYVWGSALAGAYDQAYWQQYNADWVAGTYQEAAFLYAETPDVDACRAGRPTQAAKDRALEAMNQIRALHHLSPVQYSSRYDRQVQEAALIRAAGGKGHYPDPNARCYTQAGAAGSATSNLWRFTRNGRFVDLDPAFYVIDMTNDANNSTLVAAAGHRRWMLNPFATYMSYGQVEGAVALKVFGFDDEPVVRPQIEVEYVAFPYEIYPFNLLRDDPPWSFSVVEDKTKIWGNTWEYFDHAAVTVTRVYDGVSLAISNRYADTQGYGGGQLPQLAG